MNVMMNNNVLYQNMVSGRNPAPICIPMPIPTSQVCMKFFDIYTMDRNIHICLDMEGNFNMRPIFVSVFEKIVCENKMCLIVFVCFNDRISF